MSKSKVVARLTMTKRSGKKTIVEVHEDAGWSTFYSWYELTGIRKKVFLRHSDRNNCGNPYRQDAGLEQVASKVQELFDKLAGHPNPRHAAMWSMQQIVESRIQVFRKRLYKKLLTCSPDQLPGGLVHDRLAEREVALFIPSGAGRVRIRYGDSSMKRRLDRVFAEKVG